MVWLSLFLILPQIACNYLATTYTHYFRAQNMIDKGFPPYSLDDALDMKVFHLTWYMRLNAKATSLTEKEMTARQTETDLEGLLCCPFSFRIHHQLETTLCPLPFSFRIVMRRRVTAMPRRRDLVRAWGITARRRRTRWTRPPHTFRRISSAKWRYEMTNLVIDVDVICCSSNGFTNRHGQILMIVRNNY